MDIRTALARWRTLHELCVTFLVLANSDALNAKMYDDYEYIEAYKKAKAHNMCYKEIGGRKIDERRIRKLQAACDRLKSLYGKKFLAQNGWAVNLINTNGQIQFKDIESLSGLQHFRYFYLWACDNIHSGISGVRKRLGLMDGEDHKIFMGASNFGLAEPAKFTSYSMLMMNAHLLELIPSLKNKIVNEIFGDLHNDIVRLFDHTHNTLLTGERNMRKRGQ